MVLHLFTINHMHDLCAVRIARIDTLRTSSLTTSHPHTLTHPQHSQLWQHPETATVGLADLSSGLSNWFTSTLSSTGTASTSTAGNAPTAATPPAEDGGAPTKPSRVRI